MRGIPLRPEDVLLFIVDDDDDTRSNLHDILELDGYQIAEASCAQDLFALPEWERVALILLDRKLPDGSPEDLIPQINERAPQASVIIVTGYSDVTAAVSALRLGAADYILKPINPDALRASLRRELEHQSSQRQLQSLFENALDGFVIFDDGEVMIDANPAACSMLSMARSELIDKNLKTLLEPSATVDQAGARLFSPLLPQGERGLRCRNGRQLQIEHQVTYNFSPGLHLVSIRDITERKLSEQRALQAERLAAIGETMTALTHESRNALQRSFACLEMLALEVEDRPAALDLLARARKAQEQLRQLYEEVRQWAAPINVQAEPADLAEIWREAWHNVLQVHRAKHVRLKELVTCEPSCRIDPSKIGQVFRNIFENAVDVSPDQSTVELNCAQEGTDHLIISVQDSGPGLSSEQLARAFEPFFTTKTKGTGLGLAIAKRIVQAHQGVITASSSSGACIQLTLPRGMP